MRLINTNTGQFTEFTGRNIPPYAILSHTWQDGEEVTYDEIEYRLNTHKKGWMKIWKTCELARGDGLCFAWVDTCCIDKSSSAELSEAINSMYRWYRRSVVCYSFLFDLNGDLDESLRCCRWFTRGWTLQELIAPPKMLFFDAAWRNRGTKDSLARRISDITRIDARLLQGKATLSEFSVAQKLSWAAPRQTTRIEDLAYCLLGIFDLNLPLLYGEEKGAFRRLQGEIIRTTGDMSIFAWRLLPLNNDDKPMSAAELRHIFDPDTNDLVLTGVLADSPAEFYCCGDYRSNPGDPLNEMSITSIGIKVHIRLLLSPLAHSYVLPLGCMLGDRYLGIVLRQVRPQVFLRGDPRLVYEYNDRMLYTGKLQKVQPVERSLLLRFPDRSGYHDFRLGHASRILPRVRSFVVRFISPWYLSLIEPWPLNSYDHQDKLFSVSGGPRHDFSCVKISATVPYRNSDGTLEILVFGACLCALGWSAKDSQQAQFSVIEGGAPRNVVFNKLLSMAAGSDYHTGQIRNLMDSYQIPISTTAVCPINGTSYVALVSINPQYIVDWDICTRGHWSVQINYSIRSLADTPAMQKLHWVKPDGNQNPPFMVRNYRYPYTSTWYYQSGG